MKKIIAVLTIISGVLLLDCEEKKGGVTGNTPPSIKEASIYPDQPTSQTRAKVIVDASDRENDNITYKVKWFVNGKEVAEGVDFSASDIRRNDVIYALVTPYDSKEYGKTVKTKVVTAGNTPPRILEAKLDPDSIYATTKQAKVNIKAIDHDGDSLRYICHWHLGAERLADSATAISGLQLKKGDLFTVDVLAFDGESLSLGYVITGSVANSPPRLGTKMDSLMASPDSFVYSLPISDPDGDRLTFSLVSGPATVQIDQNTGQLSGRIEEPSPIEIRATDEEGSYLNVRFTVTPAR